MVRKPQKDATSGRRRAALRGGFVLFISLVIVLSLVQAVFGIPPRPGRGNPFRVPGRWTHLLRISQQYGQEGSIQGYVCEDLNGDGYCGFGEPGIQNVLVDVDNVWTAYTDNTGYYYIGGLPFGIHTATVHPPAGYTVNKLNPVTFGVDSSSPNFIYDFPLVPATPTPTPTPTNTPTNTPTPTVTPTFTPTPATTATPTPTPVPNYRFWGQVSGPNDTPLADVLVQLFARRGDGDTWTVVKEDSTRGNGRYFIFRWENKGYRQYRIVVQPPSGYVAVRAQAPSPGHVIDPQTIEYRNIPSGYYLNNNFFLAPPTPTPSPTPTFTPTSTPTPTPTFTPTPTPTLTPTPTPSPTPGTGSVQGVVWQDDNLDGRRQEGEKGVPGVTLRLSEQTRAQALTVWETTTDATGFYRFTNIPPGTYILSFVSQVGFYPTTETTVHVNAGANTVVEVNFGVYALPRRMYMPLMAK